MTWTDERVAQLKTLHAQGFSFTIIAGQIGGITRNAAIGKATRMGLSRQANRVSPASRAKRIVERKRRVVAKMLAPQPEMVLPPSVPVLNIASMCQMHDLTDSSCRWPLWQDDTPPSGRFYCGDPTAAFSGGRPYCPYHADIAYDGSRAYRASFDPTKMQAAE